MRSIIIKELRENAKWAVLLLLGLSAALAFAVHADIPSGLSLVGNVMGIVSAVGFPVVGLALGLLQVLQDNRPGRWGFLTHRPISRTRIFFGKVLAGIVLYSLVTGVPLGAVIAWVATPGHIAAPFDWHMVLPRLADLFGGLMWYATGLFIASRKARWIGSRLMPIGPALVVASYAWAIPLDLLHALLVLSVGIVLLLPPAWGAFISAGDFEPQPPFTKFLQTISVSIGVGLSVALAAGILSGIVQTFSPRPNYRNYSYQIDNIGRVMRVTSNFQGPVQVADLEDHPLSTTDRQSFLQNPLSAAYLSLEGYPTADSPWDLRRRYWGLQGPDAYLHLVGQSGPTEWFYVARRKTIEGFDTSSRNFVGSIGPDGFLPASQPPIPFPEIFFPQQGYIPVENIAGRTVVYRLDVEEQKIRTIFKTSSFDPVIASSMDFKNGKMSSLLDAIVTSSAIHIMDDGQELCRLPLEHSAPNHMLTIGQTKDGHFIEDYKNVWPGKAAQPDFIVETDAHGRILSRKELPPLPDATSGDPGAVVAIQLLACPPSLLTIPMVFRGGHIGWIVIIIASSIAILAVIPSAILCQRYSLGRGASFFWITFSLLAGLAGPLSICALYQLPAKVKCAGCGKRRITTRDLCQHCGVPFAPPPLEGIEIFEMV